MLVLTYTSLYPTPRKPVHGVFVHELTKSLARLAQVQVLVPENGWRGLADRLRHGSRPTSGDGAIRCRFWTVPRFFKFLDGRLMALCSREAFQSALAANPDLVHAHYAYPDAAAAAILAGRAGLPLVVTCHGSDINVLARDPARAKLMARALRQAAAVVAVSRDLAGKIARLGVPPERIRHIPNGVDLSLFPLADKARARASLGLTPSGPLLVGAGRLEPVKGYDRLLRALARLDGVRLVLAGDGSLRESLAGLARRLHIEDRVTFAGMVPHEELAPYFQAADLLVISSHSEGWPTIIHEALACGTPVAAPALGGIPEALARPGLGLIFPSAEPEPLALGIREALDTAWNPEVLRRAAAAHDWNAVAAQHLELYEQVLGQTR